MSLSSLSRRDFTTDWFWNSKIGQSASDRLKLEYLESESGRADIHHRPGWDVVAGLQQTPKTLPPQYFYDDRGSQLFEAICQLPEYYPTRTETQILRTYGRAIAHVTGPCELVELGSGSSTKTRLLLDAYGDLGYPLCYVPNDVSAGILEQSALALLADYPQLHIRGLIGTYELALQRLESTPLPARMICFLGSTLGNLQPPACDAFFSRVMAALQTGDYFLLGVDLRKPLPVLETAYNDSQGVTAAFNLNMLRHLNHRFHGNFDLEQFEHWAFYNPVQHRIEMHLRSLKAQSVDLKSLGFTVAIAPEETIITEISRKFSLAGMKTYLRTQGLCPLGVWTDPLEWFGLFLAQRPEGV